jgi:uncharacterized protein YfdQ (DUF2303 family)
MSETEPPVALIGESMPEAILKIENKDVLERLVALGREANNLELVTLETNEDLVGLPKKIPVALLRGATPKLEGVKALFEPYRTAPERRNGTATVDNLQSFIELVNRHKDEHSVIFADTKLPNPKLTAVIDYHQTDHAARFGKHRIEYAFPLSEEYKAWAGGNGKKFEQAEFAAFLEDRIADLASPLDVEKSEYEDKFKVKFGTPNEIVELSRGLRIFVNSQFKTAVTLQSGEAELSFQEEHRDAKGEKLFVPGLFMISVPAFDDGEPLRIPARLRYRPAGGSVSWFYQLYRPDFWLRQQIKNDLLTASQQTGLPAYEGAPEA